MENIPLRIDLSGDPRVSELIARIRGTFLEAYEYRELPLTEIVRSIRPGDEAPVFQAMFELEHLSPLPVLPGVRVTLLAADGATAKMDLDVVVSVGRAERFRAMDLQSGRLSPPIGSGGPLLLASCSYVSQCQHIHIESAFFEGDRARPNNGLFPRAGVACFARFIARDAPHAPGALRFCSTGLEGRAN